MKLRNLAMLGDGVLVAAIPNPKTGCIMKNGNTMVAIPNAVACNILGSESQFTPTIQINTIPIR